MCSVCDVMCVVVACLMCTVFVVCNCECVVVGVLLCVVVGVAVGCVPVEAPAGCQPGRWTLHPVPSGPLRSGWVSEVVGKGPDKGRMMCRCDEVLETR